MCIRDRNYTDYREWNELLEEQEKEEKNLEAKVKTKNQENVPQPNAIRDKATIGEESNKRKLTFKEKKEFDTLEIEIPVLEIEKTEIERQLSSGELSTCLLYTSC